MWKSHAVPLSLWCLHFSADLQCHGQHGWGRERRLPYVSRVSPQGNVTIGAYGNRVSRGTEGKGIPLHLAALQNSNVEVVRLLLERGGAEQLAAQDQDGRIPLHLAAEQNSNVEVARLLLGRGSPRSSTDRYGRTPLDRALRASADRAETLQLLVEAGAALDGAVQRLPPSLQAAARSVSVSSVLLSYFADNVTPLGAAVRRCQRACRAVWS